MTLILTAISQKGISVCADKRYRVQKNDGSVMNYDDNNKIYKFQDISLVILNHGINKIKGRDWTEYCSNYEKSKSWNKKNQFQIVIDFQQFIEKDVKEELSLHKNDKFPIGFLICGKTPQDTKYKANELFWIFSNNRIDFQHLRHQSFILTGNAKVYLNEYLKSNLIISTNKFWKSKDTANRENELIKLFKIAIDEKNKIMGDEFSNVFEVVSI